MRTIERLVCVLAASAAMAPLRVVPADDQSAARANELSVWEQHQAHFDYYSETRLYSCQVLEKKVRQLLRQLGVRQDLQVQASGCNAGTFSSSHMGTVNVTFYALAPSSMNAAANGVPGHWVNMDISPLRSRFLDGGDCELIRSMQSVLSKELSWRALQYNTSCFPHTLSTNDFHIEGSVLAQSENTSG
jgi:hypothetical protein